MFNYGKYGKEIIKLNRLCKLPVKAGITYTVAVKRQLKRGSHYEKEYCLDR